MSVQSLSVIQSKALVCMLRDKVIPTLSRHHHKGELGRIFSIVGSSQYCGAAYYCAYSPICIGADLSYVFTTATCAPALRMRSPELMVVGEIPDEYYDWSKCHSLVIGPGLSDKSSAFDALKAMKAASELNEELPVVLDASIVGYVSDLNEGRYQLGNNLSFSLSEDFVKNCVLTPNKREFDRLYVSAFGRRKEILGAQGKEATEEEVKQFERLWKEMDNRDKCDPIRFEAYDGVRALKNRINARYKEAERKEEDALVTEQQGGIGALPLNHPLVVETATLAAELGVTIVRKGFVDIISDGKSAVFVALPTKNQCLRRSGGQGDILAGCIATMLPWALRKSREVKDNDGSEAEKDCWTTNLSPMMMASVGASAVVRQAAAVAFAKHKRSMTAQHIMQELGAVMEANWPAV